MGAAVGLQQISSVGLSPGEPSELTNLAQCSHLGVDNSVRPSYINTPYLGVAVLGVKVGAGVGVSTGEWVGDAVGCAVGTGIGAGVGVLVGEGVRVGVSVGDGVGLHAETACSSLPFASAKAEPYR